MELTKYEKEELHYLYHSYKNESLILTFIPISLLGLAFQGPLVFIIIWGWIWVFCNENNKILAKDSEVIKRRQWYKEKYGITKW